MDGGSDIRLLTAGDLDGALALSATAGWNQRDEDWRMLLRLAPAGSFAALDDGRVVGTAIGIDYRRFGWIAMMLVDPEYRGKGIGARLLEAAMAAIPGGLPIRLDATPLGRPLYQRYGFEHETTLSRQVREASDRPAGATREAAVPEVRPLTGADLARVIAHDHEVFGADRQAVLEWSLEGAPGYAWFLPDGSGRPQYCLGRRGRLFDHIGPVVAATPTAAAALAAAALHYATGCRAVLDAFDASQPFNAWLRDAGFQLQRPLYRMRRPGGAAAGPADTARSGLSEFAILGPEFG